MKLKFLTLNLYNGGEFFDNILPFLQTEQPDIAVFQEVYNGSDPQLPKNLRSIEVLKHIFPGYYVFFSPEFKVIRTNPIEGKIDIGNAIFSRFPIVKEQVEYFLQPYGEHSEIAPNNDYSRDPTLIQVATIDVNGQQVTVANTHGIWELSGQDTPERLRMSEIIVKNLQGKPNVLFAGDFNVQPHTKTITTIESILTNVFKDQLKTTFNLSRKDLEKYPGYAEAVVDMMFVSPDIKVIKSYAPSVDVSDHMPLVCEVEM